MSGRRGCKLSCAVHFKYSFADSVQAAIVSEPLTCVIAEEASELLVSRTSLSFSLTNEALNLLEILLSICFHTTADVHSTDL